MKSLLIAFALLLCTRSFAQDKYTQLFATNPYLSNGYFIVNTDKWAQLDLDHIDVHIVLATLMPDGTVQKSTIQQFSIQNNFYGKADLGFLDTLKDGQSAHYKVDAYDQGGNDVLGFEAVPPGGMDDWPLLCSHTCNSASYAWTINLYSNGGQSRMVLEDAGDPNNYNGYYYFYVPANDWSQFTQQYDPSDFHLDVIYWTILGTTDQVIPFDGGVDDPLPPNAHDMEGLEIDGGLLGAGGVCHRQASRALG